MRAKTFIAILTLCVLQAAGGRAIAQNPLTQLENAAKEKVADAAITKLLNDQLPLVLNADDVYPTVKALPGGPFQPRQLNLAALDPDEPLPPGDYTIPTVAVCSEYSVHVPGAGVAYVLGPMQGKAATAIAELYWRGSLQYHIDPGTLMRVGWAIQSGIPYANMPKIYQAMIDKVIPDLKGELAGDFFQSLESTYQSYAKTLQLPPLDQVLAKAGGPGQLALSAERQRTILLNKDTSDQIKDQTLFQGQESGIYTPVKAEDGPWTERIKGVAYMKLTIVGGNGATNNMMQIRILPQAGAAASIANKPHLVRASYGQQTYVTPQQAFPTLAALVEGIIGYSEGRGAQALAQVPAIPYTPPPPTPVLAGKVTEILGTVTVTRNGVTTTLNVNDPIYMGDKLQTGDNSHLMTLLSDETQISLAPDSKFGIDAWSFDQEKANAHSAVYTWTRGAILYVSGLIAKNGGSEQIETRYGNIGIRGTELVGRMTSPGTIEVDLIQGSAAVGLPVTAATPTTPGPAKITLNGTTTTVTPLTQADYEAIKAQAQLKSATN